MKNNLGILNDIFLENASNILKKENGRKIIKEYVEMFKKNKNLSDQMKIYSYFEKLKAGENITDYITEGISSIRELQINLKEAKKSNNDVYEFLCKNIQNMDSNCENKSLFEQVEKIIFTKNNFKSLHEKIEAIGQIKTIINEKVECDDDGDDIIIENIDVIGEIAINKFNNKYSEQLTEDEKILFKKITGAANDSEKEDLFESERKECIKLTNKILTEVEDVDVKEQLLNVKEKLLEQKYSSDTYFEDVLSLIELKNSIEIE